MRFLIIAVLALVTVSCATKYQDMGFSGGVSAQQMTSDTYRIVARGNSYTASTTIQDYMVLKAAETTKGVGGTHFVVLNSADASHTTYSTTSGSAQTSYIGNTAYTTYTPGTVSQHFKPGQDAYIRVLKVSSGKKPPAGAMSADEVIRFVGSRVQRG